MCKQPVGGGEGLPDVLIQLSQLACLKIQGHLKYAEKKVKAWMHTYRKIVIIVLLLLCLIF
jgi:hypothetical protein